MKSKTGKLHKGSMSENSTADMRERWEKDAEVTISEEMWHPAGAAWLAAEVEFWILQSNVDSSSDQSSVRFLLTSEII